MELSALDENKLDRIIAHRSTAVDAATDTIIAPGHALFNNADAFISTDGEKVARQIRQVQKRLSKEEVGQVILAYQGGKSTNELARLYGCNHHTICDQLKKHGVRLGCAKIKSEEEVRRAIALYESNLTMDEVATQFGVSATTINRLLHENGVKLRSRWDYCR